MSKSKTSLAQISRDPILRKALKSSASNGDAFAVATGITPGLVEAYSRWLELESALLKEEIPNPPLSNLLEKMPDMTGWPVSDVERMLEIRKRQEQSTRECALIFWNLHARAGLRDGKFKSPVDRFYVSEDMAIISPPASTRAALVLGAVRCDWRV